LEVLRYLMPPFSLRDFLRIYPGRLDTFLLLSPSPSLSLSPKTEYQAEIDLSIFIQVFDMTRLGLNLTRLIKRYQSVPHFGQ